MFPRILYHTVLVGSLITCMPALAGDEVPTPSQQVDQAAQIWLQRMNISGTAIAGITNGQVAWIGTYGKAAPERPVTRETVFNVASLTKPVFAVMALHLVAEQQLALDGSLAEYWADPDVADNPWHKELTPRLVLSHQSGLPNWRGERPLDFMFKPGTRHEYSGEGYEYLRRAIEKKTASKLPQLMRQYVTQPANLKAMYFGWAAEIEPQFAIGYNEGGEQYQHSTVQQRSPAAASSLFTTIGDYAGFAAWVARGADLPPALFNDMQQLQAQHENPAEYFGLGWRIIHVNGTTVIAHDGREDGVRTQVYISPQDKSGLVILTNSANGELLTRPIVLAALDDGHELLTQIDKDTWHYLQALPPNVLGHVFNAISRSPSFTAKLLHTVDTVLLAAVQRTAKQRQQAQEDINAFINAILNRRVQREEVEQLLMSLGQPTENGLVLHTQFSAAQSRQWQQQLHELAQRSPERNP